jgi:hypothetical protein
METIDATTFSKTSFHPILFRGSNYAARREASCLCT